MFLFEVLPLHGDWQFQISPTKPVAGKDGRMKRSGGMGPKVRNVVELPEHIEMIDEAKEWLAASDTLNDVHAKLQKIEGTSSLAEAQRLAAQIREAVS